MRVVVTTEAHLTRDPAGVVRSDTGGRAYAFWSRYLDVFEDVAVVARVSAVDHEDGAVVEGPSVRVIAVEGYHGLRGTLLGYWRLRAALRAVVGSGSRTQAYSVRVPGVIGSTMAGLLRRRGASYAAEVVGDPYDVFSGQIVNRPVDAGLRAVSTAGLRRIVRGADCVAYVTSQSLQRRYPARPGSTVESYSSVQLPAEAFVDAPREPDPSGRTLVAVGTQSQMYKGHDLLITAAADLAGRGRSVRVRLVGDGRYQERLRAQARSEGLEIDFVGRVPAGAGVRHVLDSADLFVMPSRTEGLPRALIEAMARGLPAIGSRVGAIPELLEETELVEPDSASELADAIDGLLADLPRRRALGAANLTKAGHHADVVLQGRRRLFYAAVRSAATHSTIGGVDRDERKPEA